MVEVEALLVQMVTEPTAAMPMVKTRGQAGAAAEQMEEVLEQMLLQLV
jgi:hypothetical protein